MLGAGEPFAVVGGAEGGIELDVEPGFGVGFDGALVDGHDVGEVALEEGVIGADEAMESDGEIVEEAGSEFAEVGEGFAGDDVDFVGVAGEIGAEDDEGVVFEEDAEFGFAFGVEPVGHEAPSGAGAVLGGGFEFGGENGRDEGGGVDLSVRVAEGDSDFGATIFEDVDVGDAGFAGEVGSAVSPDAGEFAELIEGESAEGGFVVLGVADDFAVAGGGIGGEDVGVFGEGDGVEVWVEGGEPVLEDGDFVGGGRDFGFEGTEGGGAKRAEIGGRVVGAVLPVRGVDHPLATEGMPPQFVHGTKLPA